MTDLLADTSIFVGLEQRRPLGDPPDGAVRISAVTLAELDVGVRLAQDPAVLARRQETLAYARRFRSVPFDDAAAEQLARIVAALRRAGRRVNAYDAVIAATAASRGLAVWTQDDDFDVIAEVAGGLLVVRA